MPSMSAKRLKGDIWKMAGEVGDVPGPDSQLPIALMCGTLLRRLDVTEHRQQSQVVGCFQHTTYEEWPAEA